MISLTTSQKIKYNYSGKYEDVKQVLRQFATNEVLKRINKEASNLFTQKGKDNLLSAKWVSYDIFDPQDCLHKKTKTIVTAWGLVNLAYYTIIFSNDYRGKSIEKDEELFMLFDAVEGMRQRDEESWLNKNDDQLKNLLYIWGFAGEQLKMEHISKVLDNAGRELYILFESSKNVPDKSIDVVDIVRNERGYEWNKILCALYLGWFFFINRSDYQRNIMHFNNDAILSEQEFQRIIVYYSCTYKEVRDSCLCRQILYTKPYVKTQKDELVSISPYLNLFLYEHSIFWIVRDYCKKNNINFPSYFGYYFEAYVEELLSDCLSSGEFEKIHEDKTRKADWKINTGDYKLLVEQKSTIIRLSVKQQVTDTASLENFAVNTVIEALQQLQNTENQLGDGKYIKIILLYEDYIKSEFLEAVFSMSQCTIKSDDCFWLVSIEEFELLLYLRYENVDLFNKIIADKINREVSHSNSGRGLSHIFQENGINKNSYLEQDKFQKYKNLARDQSRLVLNG